MRVACHTIDDFLANLKEEPPERVLGGVVYLSTTKNPIDGDRQKAVKWRVDFQASAVLSLKDGGEYLLEAGEHCGTDYKDVSQEYIGSERADELRRDVVRVCGERGLTVRPGVVGV